MNGINQIQNLYTRNYQQRDFSPSSNQETGLFYNLQDSFTPSGSESNGIYSPKMILSYRQQNDPVNDTKKKENKPLVEGAEETLDVVDKTASGIDDSLSGVQDEEKLRKRIDKNVNGDRLPSVTKTPPKTEIPKGVKSLVEFTGKSRIFKAIPGLGDAAQIGLGALDVAETRANTDLTKEEKVDRYAKAAGKTIGAITGGTIGSALGTSLGAAAGAVGGPVGVAIGGFVGGGLGGFVGDEIGGAIGEYVGGTSLGNYILGGAVETVVGTGESKQPKRENVEVNVLDGFSQKVEDTRVAVSKPADGSSKAVRDNVMYSFGMTDEMIAAYDKKYPTDPKFGRPINDGFYIHKQGENRWATPQEVEGFTTDQAGNVLIDVGADSVRHLKEFAERFR